MFSPAEIGVRQCVEDRVFAFLEECAGALVWLLVGVAMLLGLHRWAGGHIVGIFKSAHVQDFDSFWNRVVWCRDKKTPDRLCQA